jgi:hypothetical protein
MARIGVVVVDIHSDADHPDAITIIEWIERMVEEITADVSYILLEYAPEEAHPYLTTLLPDATVFPQKFSRPIFGWAICSSPPTRRYTCRGCSGLWCKTMRKVWSPKRSQA